MMSEVEDVEVVVDDDDDGPPSVDEKVVGEGICQEQNGDEEKIKEDKESSDPKDEIKPSETNGNKNGEKEEEEEEKTDKPESMTQQINNVRTDLHPKCSVRASHPAEVDRKPVELKLIHVGDTKVRAKLRFEVVTARVIETGGKKHVAYTIMMKRVGHEPQPAVIERRYNDFCFIYECILRSFHPSILGDFQFPKKVLLGNFKAEVISERTDAFHKFLNLIANCNNLLYSDYFYSFLSSEEHNEAVSHIKLARYAEAIPLLETIFCVREKLLTIANVHVVLVLCELVACLSAESVGRNVEAFSYGLVAMRGFELVRGHPDVEPLRVSFLKLSSDLASDLGQDKKQFERQLSELRYSGVRLHNAKPLLEVIRDRYIHRASHTSKIS